MSELTFVIPAFNAAATLGATLDSLMAQTRGDWRAIVIDDGSTDGTAKLADDYARRDHRIIRRSTINQGVCRARNLGLSLAQTPWVAFLDADDVVSAAYVAHMLAPSQDPRGWEAIYCGYRRVTTNGSIAAESLDLRLAADGFKLLAKECPIALHCVITRRERLMAVGGFDPDLPTCEDWDLWQRLARQGLKLRAVPLVLADYRLSARSLSSDFDAMCRDGLTVLRRGYAADPRVGGSLAQWKKGVEDNDLAARETYFVAWCAAAKIGSGQDGQALFETIPRIDTGGRADSLAQTVLAGLAVGARRPLSQAPNLLSAMLPKLQTVLQCLARAPLDVRGLIYALEREAIGHAPESFEGAIQHTAVRRVRPNALTGYDPPANVDRLVVRMPGARGAPPEVPLFGPLTAGDFAGLCAQTLTPKRFFFASGALWSMTFWREACTRLIAALTAPSARSRRTYARALKRALLDAALARWGPPGPFSLAAQTSARRRAWQEVLGDVPRACDSAAAPPPLDAPDRKQVWDRVFEVQDPWNYGCAYETEKYDLTLEAVLTGKPKHVLELACAEGRFTERLAASVEKVSAADISTRALARAAERCRPHDNVDFKVLDLIEDALPADLEMIVCSEVLYYLPDRPALTAVVDKIAQALAPGGRLVMANHFLLRDDPDSTGFDWDQAYGAKVIHEAFSAHPELRLESSTVTELYRVDCFRRGEATSPSPKIQRRAIVADLPLALEQYVVRGGAAALKSQLLAETTTWDVPVLAYHRIADEGPEALAAWRVRPRDFRVQMQFLRRHGYYTVTPERLLEHIRQRRAFPGRPILITFDDAYQDFADAAWPILQACGFGATVFTVTDRVGQSADWDQAAGPPARLMDQLVLDRLNQEGVNFGSHLATHGAATALSSLALLEEAISSRAKLEAWTRKPVVAVAAPYGLIDERYQRVISSAGFQLGFTSHQGLASVWGDQARLPRLEVRGDWGLAQFAGALSHGPKAEDFGEEEVSVIIPAYNAELTIDATLHSVRGQTHSPLEILVVDDGSTDGTVARVRAHMQQDARVRLLTQANGGVAAARNLGISACRGALIAPVDADDLWSPDKIERQLRVLQHGGPSVALVYTWYAVIDAQGRIVETNHRPRDEGDVLARLCRGNLIGNGSSPLIRKAAVIEAGGYCSRLRDSRAQGCEDLLLYFRIAERHDFAVVADFLTGYRRLPEAMSSDVTQMLRSYRMVGEEMKAKYPRYAAEVDRGEVELAGWLFWKAVRNRRLRSAAIIFAHVVRLDARKAVRLSQSAVRRAGARLLRRRVAPGASTRVPFVSAVMDAAR
ncbi:glycosyltransferase [Caulobacter endophyticus]|uniref:glycosyltransferase n=1 Tax=Caulobacter endophyticus TaxID=2172652 RepID=UPI002410A8F0|nr:glycosyltransferase [Caulobacter endophyticus]MDG2528027.1 glycosyltransferase [Caulobacter endophyticus]